MKARLLAVLTLIVLLVLACGPSPAASPVATRAPGAIVAPATSAPAAPTRGGKVVMALWQSPTTLNDLLGTQTVVGIVNLFYIEGMTMVLPDGTRAPQLAKELPTLQNGGVSADGKTITYNLKDGVLWSDGKPLTCDDFAFLWQAIMTPGVGVTSTEGYREIEAVECPSPTRVVVKYKNFYAPYLTLFNTLLPKHYAGDPKDMPKWAYNRKPLGVGPFKVDEWVADDHITLSRNPNYYKKDRPSLDQVIIRIVPSREVAMQLLVSGEVDIVWNNIEADIPQLEKTPGVKVGLAPRPGGERIALNLAENKDPADPKKPHFILSDQRVRQAIAYGINKQVIIDRLLLGKASPGTTDLNAGPFACDIKAYAYDPEKAKSLLTEAGWVAGADGIRVAKGAKVAPDGTRLRLKFSTTTGDKLREDSQVLMLENMKAIGIEFFIENAPSSVVLGTWADGAPRRHGNYDLVMYSTRPAQFPRHALPYPQHRQRKQQERPERVSLLERQGGRVAG